MCAINVAKGISHHHISSQSTCPLLTRAHTSSTGALAPFARAISKFPPIYKEQTKISFADAILSKQIIYINDLDDINVLVSEIIPVKDCMDYQISEIIGLDPLWTAAILKKNSPWFEAINNEVTLRTPVLTWARNRKRYHIDPKCYDYYFPDNERSQELGYRPLTVSSLSGVFVVLSILLCITVVQFVGEICVARYRPSKKPHTPVTLTSYDHNRARFVHELNTFIHTHPDWHQFVKHVEYS